MTVKDSQGNTMDQAFNLTMSIRTDSDIPIHLTTDDVIKFTRYTDHATRLIRHENYYGRLLEDDDAHLDKIWNLKFNDTNETNGNLNYVAWVVSNCNTTPGAKERLKYGNLLIDAGLKLDGYGECFKGKKTDHGYKLDRGFHSNVKWLEVLSKYKFYLAFENGIHCNGYISEKFWRNALKVFTVPVVFGPHKDDVKKIAPPYSYIHAEDFKTPKDLVNYLEYLNKNKTAYMEYHNWRVNIKPDMTIPTEDTIKKRLCGTCRKLKEKRAQGYPIRMIKSVTSWWWMNLHDEKCTDPNKIPKFLKKISPPVSMEENWWDELRRGKRWYEKILGI